MLYYASQRFEVTQSNPESVRSEDQELGVLASQIIASYRLARQHTATRQESKGKNVPACWLNRVLWAVHLNGFEPAWVRSLVPMEAGEGWHRENPIAFIDDRTSASILLSTAWKSLNRSYERPSTSSACPRLLGPRYCSRLTVSIIKSRSPPTHPTLVWGIRQSYDILDTGRIHLGLHLLYDNPGARRPTFVRSHRALEHNAL